MSEMVELLTNREKEVLELVVKGMSNKKISEEFNISTGTVQCHMENIFSKYGVHNRKKLIVEVLKK